MCGGFSSVIVDIRKLPVQEWSHVGNYETDRDFRKRFHQWIAGVWQEKDQKISELSATRS